VDGLEQAMRILVTGSAGTLGGPLVTELRKRGHEVTGADLRHWPGEIRTDVAEPFQIMRTFKRVRPEVCYHLAGEFGRINGEDYVEQLWRTNCLGTRNVIDCCKPFNTRLIFASSSEAYGNIGERTESPLQELDTTDLVPAFYNEYALTKWTNEKQIEIAVSQHKLRATILRFFNVYGPGEYYSDYRSVVCLFIYRALKGLPITVYSETKRSFLYIDDWVQAVANVLDVTDDTFNIASTRSVTMKALMAMVVNEVVEACPGCAVEVANSITWLDTEPHNVRDKVADITKAAKVLGLRDSVSLEEGIRRTVDWMREVYP
jgi:dTDP-glucose 4,6-dehydratase